MVAIGNEHKIPVWTISTGHNFGYGTAAPYDRGQVILDLKKLNKIIEVDPVLCTALVEPGVTYQQLVDYIKEKGYKLWLTRRLRRPSSARSATRSTAASVTRRIPSISCSPAVWKWCWPVVKCCAPPWAA
jgi:hypothetical protein